MQTLSYLSSYLYTSNNKSTEENISDTKSPPEYVVVPAPMSDQEAIVTNKRYMNENVVWGRPKGLIVGNMVGAGAEQKANLYPDKSSTYYVMNFCLPPGGSLTLKSQYPYARYVSFTIANQLGGGQLGNGTFLRGDQITPNSKSFNPFIYTNSRDVTPRYFTLYVVQGNAPQQPAENTLYTGTNSESERIHLSMRTYLVDIGYDGTGNVKLDEDGNGLPEVILNLPNGDTVTGPNLLELLRIEKKGDPTGYTISQWLGDIDKSNDKKNAPCLPEIVSEVFWNTCYSVTGCFHVMEPLKRVTRYPPSTAGGFANNPDTKYMVLPYSFDFGNVVVIRGKMPTHPNTRRGETTLPEDPQVQYFSISTAAAPGSGEGWDTVFDEQIQVDKYGYFTVIISWPWNRPSNATLENGVCWLNPQNGEGNYVGARNWIGIIYIRYQNSSPNWKESPENIPMPSIENPIPRDPVIMKEYYPVGKYTTTEEFNKNWVFEK